MNKPCTISNCIEQSLILVSAISSCVSISVFALWTDIFFATASLTVGLENFAMTAGIKKCKSRIKEEKK